jgi:hypothetical protein
MPYTRPCSSATGFGVVTASRDGDDRDGDERQPGAPHRLVEVGAEREPAAL